MKKTPSLYKRNYDDKERLVYDDVIEGSKWVLQGEGFATVKFDGTSCRIRNGQLFKRYDRKLTKEAARRKKRNGYVPNVDDYKPAPDKWEAAELEPNLHTGHWPGWVPVNSDAPEDQYHQEAFDKSLEDGTYELVGPKIQGNPHQLDKHELWKHGSQVVEVPLTFDGLRQYFLEHPMEGIVWHHPDGRLVKIKTKDFGIPWPR
ncbi:DUF5565 family protein [Pleionea sp. CnH1-48]|uniref:RNA ligase 1 family protein n=1 Tax=Pleionea sp. CnH1-48 TaxID=2954494 RepID=UPI0020975367|nr:DUF5565 family protein [Pleionea sp. CnH1-48]MCO7224373.1 DUF5565 family protein [Pleionea sp. CnH1-48]